MRSPGSKSCQIPPEEGPGRLSRVYLVLVLGALSAGYGALAVRLWCIQVLAHQRYSDLGREIQRGTDRVEASKGDIISRDGIILARSLQSFELGLDPSKMSREGIIEAVQTLFSRLEEPDEVRRDRLEDALRRREKGGRYVRLARDLDEESVAALKKSLAERLSREDARAVCCLPSSHRVYPHGALVSQLLGACDVEGRGIEGLELALDPFLRQQSGRRLVIKDALQRSRIYYPQSSEVRPIDGYDAALTIELRMQRILADELERGIDTFKAAAGLGIVMDCRSGAVLAMASHPSYDPGLYHLYPSEEQTERRRNRGVESAYEPGSVMKPVVASMALEHGLTRRDELIWGGGDSRRLGPRVVRDVRDHGPLTMEEVVVYSSNCGMSELGLRLGRDRLIDALERFGFGRKTGIGLPGERSGKTRDREAWSELYTSVSVSFGYAVMVTPIQLCTAFCSIVNGGYLYRPRILAHLDRPGERIENPPEVVGRPVREETSRQMREILLRVVQEGTGKYLQMDGFLFGGKSGTADMGPLYTKENYLASFVAFAPYENPEIVVLVMIEKPKARSYYGSTVAGSVVASVLRRYYRVEDEAYIVTVNRPS
ncbi:MAG: penicillin-binding protein 2 [Planctomycetes bacterium]|nr:penicillin-binding protein 2 [Planctomycetota bacterium]